MDKINSKSVYVIGILSLFLSCNTYTIPVESFREQMTKFPSSSMKEVEINNPLAYGNIKYSSNNIDRIMVLDKKGNKIYIDNSPSIEMRVTHRNGKKYIFYFDTVILENDTLKGSRSRFAQGITRELPIKSIVKIEVQDGRKNFDYQN